MKFQSKETKQLHKAFIESQIKDLKKLEGKCFLSFDNEDSDDEDGDGEFVEAILIQEVTEKGTLLAIIASVVDDFAEIAINEELDAIEGDPCSRTEFDNVVERAKGMIEKQLSEIKIEKKKE